MSDSGGGTGIVSSAIQVANTVQNQAQYNKNLGFAKKQLRYQQALQERLFQREDSAVQRKVADMRAAGLSPVLAAGVGANAGPVVNTQAPVGERAQIPDVVGNAMALMQMEKNIAKTEADTQRTQTENAIAAQDLQRYLDTGINPRTAKGIVGEASQLVGPFQKLKAKLERAQEAQKQRLDQEQKANAGKPWYLRTTK